jgi:hypothetical protein
LVGGSAENLTGDRFDLLPVLNFVGQNVARPTGYLNQAHGFLI